MRKLVFLFAALLCALTSFAQVGQLERTTANYKFADGHRSPVWVDEIGVAYVQTAAGIVVEYNKADQAEKTAHKCKAKTCHRAADLSGLCWAHRNPDPEPVPARLVSRRTRH